MFSWKSLLALMLASTSFVLAAAPGEGGTRVDISGTVVAPPDCKINNDQMIEIDFKNVSAKKADGKQLLQTVNYNLVCSSSGGMYNSMQMMLMGDQSFANDVLRTNEIPDLGIRFYHDKTPIILNKWFKLPTQANRMLMEAAPIINPASPLPEPKNFTASATLLVSFQ